MIEVETPQEIEVVPNGVEVEARALDVEVVDLSELDITVAKREFVITGDDIYIPKLYDDAPQWMKDLVDIVVNNAMETGNAATLNEMASMLSQFAVSYVPLNQYTQSILDLSNEDARINLVIETLNSNFNDGLSEANAQIINVQNTKASKDEVIAQVITTLSAQLTNPTSELGATIGRIDQAMVNNQSANALSMQVLTSTLEGLGEDVSGNSTALQSLSTYVGVEEGTPTGTGLLADVAILQKQNDGVIETYTGTYDVMIGIEDPNNSTDNDQLDATKEPYASWLAEDVANSDIAKRSAHVGDVYIKYSNSESGYKSYERAYKFIKTVVDGTSPYATDSAGFTWSLIVDTDAQNAYVAALNAYDLADDKRRVFVDTPYAPIDEGDLWVTGTNPQVVKVYKSGSWVLADTQVDTFVSTTFTPTIAGLQTQVDGQVSYYFYDSALGQTAASVSGSASWTTDTLKRDHNGDIAYDTTLKVGYWYDRTTASWVQITGTQNAGVIEALKRAAAAKEAADNVIVSYYAWKQTTAPATQYKWMKDDNTLWEYVGSSWIAVDVKKDDTLTAYNNTTKDTTLYVHNGSNWAMITPNGLVANAKAVTDLNASLTSMGTTVSGHTSLLNTVDARIGAEGTRVESKFGYNSSLVLNGTTYNSGFGIATSLTSGSGLPTGQSEFWIKADKFKLMSADGSRKSSYSPFTVDSTTGEINFNGKVTFSNVTNVPQLGSTPQEVVNAVNSGQTTTIDGGKITTGSITANQINVNNLFAQDITYTGVITGGNVAGGGLIKSYNNKMKIDLVNGSIYIS